MGIAVWTSYSKIKIKKEHHKDALKALKSLKDYYYVDEVELQKSTSLEEALSAYYFHFIKDENEAIVSLSYGGDKGDYSAVMYALAPFMEEGSVLEMAQENDVNDYILQFNFKNKSVELAHFLDYGEYRRELGDNKMPTKEEINWYSEALHFKYEHKRYRIVSWTYLSNPDVIKQAKKQVKEGLAYGKDHPPWVEWKYEYTQGVLAEEIILEIKNDKKALETIITKNRYGALCLNSPKVVFIDLDVPSFLDSTSAEKKKEFIKQSKLTIQENVANYFSTNTKQSGILYETSNGMRLLFTHELSTPKEAEKKGYFDFVHCDSRYLKMSLIQDCFRARLTPKPWRIKKLKESEFAVCKKIMEFNSQNRLENTELNRVIDIHDKYCLNEDDSILI